jgi:hypothetical protein
LRGRCLFWVDWALFLGKFRRREAQVDDVTVDIDGDPEPHHA